VRDHAFLKQFFLFFGLFFVLMAPAAFLTPLQVTRTFGGDVWRLTAIEIAFSVGMMAGGGLIAAWGGFRNRTKTLVFSTLIMGICTFALGAIPVFWIYLVFMTLFGVSMPMLNTPTTVMLQEKVEEGYLGRVFGVMGMISTSMMPIGMLIFGPIADFIKIEWLLIGTGVFILILTFLMGRDKTLVTAGEPVPEQTA
jgi:DHA3 family macrolide efflux protein-like MFS transporter